MPPVPMFVEVRKVELEGKPVRKAELEGMLVRRDELVGKPVGRVVEGRPV